MKNHPNYRWGYFNHGHKLEDASILWNVRYLELYHWSMIWLKIWNYYFLQFYSNRIQNISRIRFHAATEAINRFAYKTLCCSFSWCKRWTVIVFCEKNFGSVLVLKTQTLSKLLIDKLLKTTQSLIVIYLIASSKKINKVI